MSAYPLDPADGYWSLFPHLSVSPSPSQLYDPAQYQPVNQSSSQSSANLAPPSQNLSSASPELGDASPDSATSQPFNQSTTQLPPEPTLTYRPYVKLSPDTERLYLASWIRTIQRAGLCLQLPNSTVVHACVLFQRFYASEPAQRHCALLVAMACVLLAAKVQETGRRARDVINVVYIQARENPNCRLINDLMIEIEDDEDELDQSIEQLIKQSINQLQDQSSGQSTISDSADSSTNATATSSTNQSISQSTPSAMSQIKALNQANKEAMESSDKPSSKTSNKKHANQSVNQSANSPVNPAAVEPPVKTYNPSKQTSQSIQTNYQLNYQSKPPYVPSKPYQSINQPNNQPFTQSNYQPSYQPNYYSYYPPMPYQSFNQSTRQSTNQSAYRSLYRNTANQPGDSRNPPHYYLYNPPSNQSNQSSYQSTNQSADLPHSNPITQILPICDAYWTMKENALRYEQICLRVFAYHFHSKTPHEYLLHIGRLLEVSISLSTLALYILNDALMCRVYIEYPPPVIACAAVYLASQLVSEAVILPHSINQSFTSINQSFNNQSVEEWWEEFDASRIQIEDIVHQIMNMYELQSINQSIDPAIFPTPEQHNNMFPTLISQSINQSNQSPSSVGMET